MCFSDTMVHYGQCDNGSYEWLEEWFHWVNGTMFLQRISTGNRCPVVPSFQHRIMQHLVE